MSMEIDVEALAKEAELGHAWHGPEKCHCHDRMPALLAAIRQLEREEADQREAAQHNRDMYEVADACRRAHEAERDSLRAQLQAKEQEAEKRDALITVAAREHDKAEARVAVLEKALSGRYETLPEDQRRKLFECLERLSNELCQTQGYILRALSNAGLVVARAALSAPQGHSPRCTRTYQTVNREVFYWCSKPEGHSDAHKWNDPPEPQGHSVEGAKETPEVVFTNTHAFWPMKLRGGKCIRCGQPQDNPVHEPAPAPPAETHEFEVRDDGATVCARCSLPPMAHLTNLKQPTPETAKVTGHAFTLGLTTCPSKLLPNLQCHYVLDDGTECGQPESAHASPEGAGK